MGLSPVGMRYHGCQILASRFPGLVESSGPQLPGSSHCEFRNDFIGAQQMVCSLLSDRTSLIEDRPSVTELTVRSTMSRQIQIAFSTIR